MALPTISIIIPTLNSSRTLKSCLDSIRTQDYAQESIEIIIVDGGSLDTTKIIAQDYGAIVLVVPDKRDRPEARKAMGLIQAKNDLALFIDSDNILPHKGWLRSMVEPILADREIVATQPLRYHYDRGFSLLNRYFALFGVNDPIAYYFNKRDRLSWAETGWPLMGAAEDRGDYYRVRFQKDKLPTLGANGFLVRKDILKRAKVSPADFFHIDINYDLVNLGYDQYGIVKDTIVHLSGDNFLTFLKKRLRFMQRYHQQDYSLRRLTFIKPLYDSVKGFAKVHDIAWFLHPLMCFAILVTYGCAAIESLIIK